MTTRFDRRQLLKDTALVAGAAAGTRLFAAPAVLAQPSPNSKVAAAVISCANQAKDSINEIARLGERIVAFADIDERQYAKTEKILAPYPEIKLDAIPKFFDYRKMLDKLQKQIDVVFVCPPDHHHATASMMAMKFGKGVYCEKPLAHSIHECRVMAEAAKKYKVTTQLGNQGHSGEGIRRLCEYIWAGAIGNVTEIHAWAPTGRGGMGGRLPTKPVPKGVHWDEWIGPGPVPRLPRRAPSGLVAELVGIRRRLGGRLGLPQPRRPVLGPQPGPAHERRGGGAHRRQRRAISACRTSSAGTSRRGTSCRRSRSFGTTATGRPRPPTHEGIR